MTGRTTDPPKADPGSGPTSVEETFHAAVRHLQLGSLQEAENLCRRILALQPRHADTLHLLGFVVGSRGDPSEGARLIRESIAINPQNADALCNLGNVLLAGGQTDEAIAAYRRALALRPDNPTALNNLGHALDEQGKRDQAIACYRRALEVSPEDTEVLSNLGLALQAQGKLAEAIVCHERASAKNAGNAEIQNNLGTALKEAGKLARALAAFRRAVTLKPDYPEACGNLANSLREVQRHEEALKWAEKAVALRPDYANGHNILGRVLHDLGRFEAAIAAFERAVALKPDFAVACNNLGNALQDMGRLEEAVERHRRAIALMPNYAEAYNNLGIGLQNLGRLDAAAAAFQCAVDINGDYAEARWNRAFALLLNGRLAEGWQDYECRWRSRDKPAHRREFGRPEWAGQPLGDRTLLLWGEQGVGDQVLYAGLLPAARQRARRCVVECEPRLVPLLSRSFSDMEAVPRSDPPHARTGGGDIAAQLAIGSLPRLLLPTFDAVPKHRGYLTADAARSAAQRAKYRALGHGPIVGISWRSNRKDLARWKSSSLLDWAPALTVPGIVFVNLQYGDCAADLAAVREKLGISIYNDAEIDSLKDLDGFAAQVAATDLVISVSNTTVHFAGALNVPVWTLLSAGLGLLWYWFRDREDSPWYPSMRLFRQSRLGEWDAVIARVASELGAFKSTWIGGDHHSPR
ncbi:MAG: tetratricopeptide repeat protein [Proteobacteria bacterium]|nr:tetratricopeptide repeat protein [Pseudomonadota bacterium]